MAGCTQDECARASGPAVEGVKGLGYLTDLREFYAASDAVVLPSDHEGFPYSLLEGAAAGRPLIGTDIPGIRCAIRHNETGLLVPPGDESALCNAIQVLASDAHRRECLGRNARTRVEREFDRKIVLDRLLDFYRTEI
jgi:glycosyltransferase involved in cell wall biosynthesis